VEEGRREAKKQTDRTTGRGRFGFGVWWRTNKRKRSLKLGGRSSQNLYPLALERRNMGVLEGKKKRQLSKKRKENFRKTQREGKRGEEICHRTSQACGGP